MMPGNRSLNLSNTVAVVVYEAWRQNGYAGGGDNPSLTHLLHHLQMPLALFPGHAWHGLFHHGLAFFRCVCAHHLLMQRAHILMALHAHVLAAAGGSARPGAATRSRTRSRAAMGRRVFRRTCLP